MKKLFVLFFVTTSLLSVCKAQSIAAAHKTNASKLEEVYNKPANAVIKKFNKLDKVRSVVFGILEVTDVAANQTVSGLHIAGIVNRSFSKKCNALLDNYEVDSLSNALNYIIGMVKTTAPDYFEYRYTSHNGLTLTLFTSSKPFSSEKKWNVLIKIVPDNDSSVFGFKLSQLAEVKGVLDEAKVRLSNVEQPAQLAAATDSKE